jgi:AcrR family transcriptional regulator
LKKDKTKFRRRVSRGKIMDEALALAEEEGWTQVTVRRLASRLEYRPPVLYHYFEGKDDLLRCIISHGFDELHKRLNQAVTNSRTSEEQLIALAMTRFKFAMENDALHALMFATNSPPWQKEVVLEAMAETKDQIAELLRNISGRTDDCHDLITHFICLIKGYNYFASELPEEMAKRAFFKNESPEFHLKQAMTRFIKSIQPDE